MGAAALAGTAFGPGPIGAQAASAPHTFKLGAFEITVVSDGSLTLPLSFVLPGRPQAEVETLFKSRGAQLGELTSQVNVALIRAGTELILVDTGAGPDFVPTLGRLADRLEAAGMKPDAITKVVFTHAHPDHLWGVIDPLGGGSLFEKARHIMTAAERDFWLQADVDTKLGEAMKPVAAGTQRRLKSIADRIETAAPGRDIVPGVTLVDTAGHTPGHASVLVQSGTEQLLIGGDALSQSVVSFAAPRWRWGPDMDADRAIATRLSLLDRMVTERITLLGYHLPWPGTGRVERKDSAYVLVQG